VEVVKIAYIVVVAIAVLSFPVISCVLVRKHIKRSFGYILCVLLSATAMSGVVLTHWLAYDWHLEKQIASLDRDGDGSFSDEERLTWSEKERKNMEAYVGDGARNVFSAIIFPLFSFVYSLTVVSIYAFIVAFKNRSSKNA